MKTSQSKEIMNQLTNFGRVSRNWCLARNNTRLSARIGELKKKGWEFDPKREGGDYVYHLISKPEGYVVNTW